MGLAAQWFSVQEVVISGSVVMFIVAIFLSVTVSRLTTDVKLHS
jgi:hypothetical protein